jgi:hypothetical protein
MKPRLATCAIFSPAGMQHMYNGLNLRCQRKRSGYTCNDFFIEERQMKARVLQIEAEFMISCQNLLRLLILDTSLSLKV